MTSTACTPASRSVVLRVLLGAVTFYRLMFSPWLGSSCRFEPSCSAYALDALETHGAAAGAYLTTRRLLRCHPWCAGGCDPVPTARHPLPATALSSLFPASDPLEKTLS